MDPGITRGLGGLALEKSSQSALLKVLTEHVYETGGRNHLHIPCVRELFEGEHRLIFNAKIFRWILQIPSDFKWM